MITVIFEDAAGRELARAAEPSNGSYLIQDAEQFPLLSLLSEVDYYVFSSDMMDQLVRELESLKGNLTEPRALAHIDEIVELARRCRDTEGARLAFTPWGETHR